MYPDIIAIGIPFMIACVVIELLYDLRNKQKNYRINAAISNISCGIFEQVTRQSASCACPTGGGNA